MQKILPKDVPIEIEIVEQKKNPVKHLNTKLGYMTITNTFSIEFKDKDSGKLLELKDSDDKFEVHLVRQVDDKFLFETDEPA